jgi:large conductance mechanosensitive channel
MSGFIAEFKAFAMRGNVVDLAVAVVIGAAFGKIVTSLVDNIITPIIGLLLGGIDFTDLVFGMGRVSIGYGKFIQSVFDFIIVAFVIFMVVKAMSKLQKKKEDAPAAPVEPTEEVKLLREIRDSVRKGL